ncbi:MAG TPA: hypothetical protein DD440_04000 [Porticoccaceae bacterium]|nr:hypothetical protein [Porticoccaceae bacterium]
MEESKLIDHCGEVVPTEYEGETCVRGSQGIPGCWQKTEASAAVGDVHGWFRTRVVGVLDADGYVKIVARLKDMVIVSRFNVYPSKIEEVVYRHSDIVECAVIGIPGKHTGEAVKLFAMSSNPNIRAEDLRSFVESN